MNRQTNTRRAVRQAGVPSGIGAVCFAIRCEIFVFFAVKFSSRNAKDTQSRAKQHYGLISIKAESSKGSG